MDLDGEQGLFPSGRLPAASFFDSPRPAAGALGVGIALGPLQIEIGGLDGELAELLFERYSPYAYRDIGRAEAVAARLGVEDRDYFIEPPSTPQSNEIRLAYDAASRRVRYLGYRVAGWFDTRGGRGEILLARGGYEPPDRALENWIRCCVAWQAAARGGALVHAASAVWRERGYLFYGESGAGKSTLSECNRRARVVSDDLSLLLPASDGHLQLVGSPFRGTYTGGSPVVGAFPLCAGFRLIQATEPAVCSVPRIRALSELVGNLPFVAEAFAARPDLFDTIKRALEPIPLLHLHFSRDDRYWDAIEAAGL